VECHCGACCQHFTHVNNFDQHRVGPYEGKRGRGRRCLTAKEMLALQSATGKPMLALRESAYGPIWTRG
jgi:hypothetical protein